MPSPASLYLYQRNIIKEGSKNTTVARFGRVENLFQISSQSHLKVSHNNSRGKLENKELLGVAEGHGDSVPGVLGGVDARPVHGYIELGEGVEQAGVLLSAGLL